MINERNYTLMCDFYELTMANGYYLSGKGDQICYFDVFYRTTPDFGGYAIACGLEEIVKYIKNLHFDNEDIEFLRNKGIFDEGFLESLKDFHFTGDLYSVKEGTPIYPKEPVMIIKSRAIEAQFLETFVLSEFNHQTLIATKSNRIVRAADGRAVSEFGARRAHGAEAATIGARAAYIAGCASTSNTLTDQYYGVPASGTMAHSWVQMFENEYEAFKAYCVSYPNNVILLIDTYHVLTSGVPNAIKAFDEVLAPMGKRPVGVRIDSGDIAYLSKRVRKMLDNAGYPDCKIFVSNSLDEYIIRDLLLQGAKIDCFGVGERLITSKSDPVFDGVYKLCAVEDSKGNIIPKIKISENTGKITTPHFKKLYRLFDKENNKAIADLIAIHDEKIDFSKPIEIFDPDAIWKRKLVEDYTVEELLVKVFENGKLIYNLPSTIEIRNYCLEQVDRLWDEVKRFENPHNYYVDLTQKLYDLKKDMLK